MGSESQEVNVETKLQGLKSIREMSKVNSPMDLLVFIGKSVIYCLYLKNRENATFPTRLSRGQKLHKEKVE